METTCIKAHKDICGDCVTVDYEDLLSVADIATGYTLHEMQREMSVLERAGLPDSPSFVAIDSAADRLLRNVNNYKKAAYLRHQLYTMLDGRERLRIFGIDFETVTLVSTYEPK